MDFIVIGAKKGGTTYLHHQVKILKNFYVPPFKETHFLLPTAKERLKTHFSEFVDNPHKLEDRDYVFAKNYFLSYKENNVPNFLSLFEMNDDNRSGEIDPGLLLLKKETIAELYRHNPKLKIIILLRDPTERFFSHIKMVTKDISVNTNDIIRQNLNKFGHQILHSKYSIFIPKWENEFPTENILYISSEELKNNKFETVSRITKFIDPKSSEIRRDEIIDNQNIGHTKYRLDPTLRTKLDAYFSDDVKFMNRRLAQVDNTEPSHNAEKVSQLKNNTIGEKS